MPLTEKGKEIMAAMTAPESKGGYGPTKGEQVFYASKNAGTISGVDLISDAMLSFGGGWPVVSETGPGDKPMSATEMHAAGQIVHNSVADDGRLGRAAADYLGCDVMTVDAKKFGNDESLQRKIEKGRDDGLPELKKELTKFLSEEEKEAEHK
jgi:hypothetical protein